MYVCGLSGPGCYRDIEASCAFHYHQRRHRHHDTAYRDTRCGSLSVSVSLYPPVLLFPISLTRDTKYECAPSSFPLSLFLSVSLHLRVSHVRFCPYRDTSRLLFRPRRTVSFSGRDYADAIEAIPINVDMPPLGSVDKFSSRMSGRISRGPLLDRILNRDDLDDAFECILTGVRLFIARWSYLVLELILGANNVGNKVPHPVQRPTSLLTCLYFYYTHMYNIQFFIC